MRGYHARPLENVSAFLQSASKICGGTLLPPLWGSYIQGDILVPEIVDSLRKPQIITAQGIFPISGLALSCYGLTDHFFISCDAGSCKGEFRAREVHSGGACGRR